MKTLHVNHVDNSGRVYCYKYDKFLKGTELLKDNTCNTCDYWAGHSMGFGVECLFDDACNKELEFFEDCNDSELHSKMQYHRLGLKTKKEVLATLKGFTDYSNLLTKEELAEDEEENITDEKETEK